ncbi:putative RecA/RadA family phage recombinase [Chitinophaga skermanii]|uniref:Putative RecA/RadA family phage recombinase n=1 Tax=Chitinophaga skermanii TaxID=331697 RepID=A0A327Q9A7_9BACT|nr:DUF2190 family protein [Chitinophaga skermanii]RAJ00464.1 putative RecA/RadA family phage recombinase [Chitinophaga skermanii]
MKNYITQGFSVQATAPEGGVTGGQLLAFGELTGVALTDCAANEQFTLKLTGVYAVNKVPSEVYELGKKLFKKDGEDFVTSVPEGNLFAGYAYTPALAGENTVHLLLK